MEKLRIGLIGCGLMMSAHVSGADQIRNAKIVAVCDIIRERAEKVAEVLDNPKIFTDWRDMVDDVDAVLVALPHDLHYECGLFFARNKKHVLMEKPLCNTKEECEDLISVCKEEGVVLMCAYPVPHYPAVRKIKELIDSGEYGRVMQISVWTEQFTKTDEFGWGSTARLGGGQFFSHGCHYVDLLLRLLGKPVSGAHLGTRVGTPWLRREGTSTVIMKFENGALGYHGATWGARGTRLGWCLEVQTEKGLLEYTKRDGAKIKLYDGILSHKPGQKEVSAYKVIWDGEASHGNLKYTYLEIDHFADCVQNGKTPITDGETALKGLELIWELYEAEHNGYVADLSRFDLGEEAHANYKAYRESMKDL